MSRFSPRALRGRKGESKALDYLLARGLTLVTRNYRCRLGELDLIMNDGDTLVFVEVRTRAVNAKIAPALTVTHTKQARLIKAARHYLMKHASQALRPCRFDVVGVADSQINWITNAFDAE